MDPSLWGRGKLSPMCNANAKIEIGWRYTLIAPKSGDITRCVDVVDNLGFPPVSMDNQQRFIDKTMI